MDLEKTLNKKFQTKSRKPDSVAEPFDYKDTDRLNRYITDRGKILPARITGLNRAKQKELEQAIKRSRKLAFMPYTIHGINIDWR
jgi:small subunit ribosomal protein S18